MKKLRLLLTSVCNRTCSGCCNNQWDLNTLPTCTLEELEGWDEIYLTGGEPMLFLPEIIQVASKVKNPTALILYTAKFDNVRDVLSILCFIDGITLTFHTQKDVSVFIKTMSDDAISSIDLTSYSLRLNIFSGIDYSSIPQKILRYWKIKNNIVWLEDCPLPEDEVFKKLENFKLKM